MAAVARVFNHPKVYGWVSDDNSIAPYVPDPSHFFLMNKEGTGAVRLDPLTGIACMVHVAALPELWGKTVEFAKEAIDWAFSNTGYSKIISLAPEHNHMAIRFGTRCGFKKEGLITKAIMKDWKVQDMIIFGLSKYDQEEELCR